MPAMLSRWSARRSGGARVERAGASVGGAEAAQMLRAGNLAKGLVVRGDLDVEDWDGNCVIPRGLHVHGRLRLANCRGLRKLPRGLRVTGNVQLFSCSNLAKLPSDLVVGGDLDVNDCTSLASLPESLSGVAGDVSAFGCIGITKLPAGLTLHGALNLGMCVNLRQLPPGLRVGKDLSLWGCQQLTRLPDDLHVGKDLKLCGCTGLRTLPAGMAVPRNLNLENCTGLTSLPAGLRVGGRLNLWGCTALEGIPEGLDLGGALYLNACSRITSLPAAILRWGPATDGEPHNIFVGGSGLSQETLEWLREVDAPGLRFHVSLERPLDGDADLGEPPFASLHEAVAFWAAEAGYSKPPALPAACSADNEATLVQFLGRLRGAKEFGIAEARKPLAKRVVEVLRLVLEGEDAYAQSEVLQRMSDSLDACDDKPVWALNQVGLVAAVAAARGDRDALRALGRRVMRLMIVHEHVDRKIRSLKWVDDVCVYLRFEVELREALDLPVAATAMIFTDYIKVEDKELEAAKADALAITEEQFETWLSEWPEWQRQERMDIASSLVWEDLPEAETTTSSKKHHRRASRRYNLLGEDMVDPVTLVGTSSHSPRSSPVWSLADLLRHWTSTGLDLNNTPVHAQDLTPLLRRVAPVT